MAADLIKEVSFKIVKALKKFAEQQNAEHFSEIQLVFQLDETFQPVYLVKKNYQDIPNPTTKQPKTFTNIDEIFNIQVIEVMGKEFVANPVKQQYRKNVPVFLITGIWCIAQDNAIENLQDARFLFKAKKNGDMKMYLYNENIPVCEVNPEDAFSPANQIRFANEQAAIHQELNKA